MHARRRCGWCCTYQTRNLSVDEIGERYRLNHVIVVKLYHPYTHHNFPVTFAYLISESRLFRRTGVHSDFFLIIAPYKYSYLLTGYFVVDNCLRNNLQTTWWKIIVLESVEFCKHTQMKAYDITKLTAKLRSSQGTLLLCCLF